MSTTEKGDRLENTFFQYLLEQQENESLIFDVYTPTICKVFKQKTDNVFSDKFKGLKQ